jgi:hypothetical protein
MEPTRSHGRVRGFILEQSAALSATLRGLVDAPF